MTTHTHIARHSAQAPFTRGSGFSLSALFAVFRQRRALANLDDHLLNDIGLTRAEADAEVKRLFWDAPASWTSRA